MFVQEVTLLNVLMDLHVKTVHQDVELFWSFQVDIRLFKIK